MAKTQKIDTTESGPLEYWVNKISDKQVRRTTINVLAAQLDVTERTIYSYINGTSTMDKLQKKAAADLLSIHIDQLL